MPGMTEAVRKAVKARMEKLGKSQGDVAKALDMERVNVTRMLSGRSGKIPEKWLEMLDYLGLELTVKSKAEGSKDAS